MSKEKLSELTEFGQRFSWILGELQNRHGINQKEIATKLGVHSASLSQLKSGASRKASMATLLLLREIYGVNPAWLQEHKGVPFLKQTNGVPATSDSVFIRHFDLKTKEVSGDLAQPWATQHISFSKDWIQAQLQLEVNQLTQTKVVGNAMEPSLMDGETILIDLSHNFVQNEKIYFLEVSGSLMVRRLRQKLDGTLLVLCDNPEFETEEVSKENATQLKILGQVRWHGGLL